MYANFAVIATIFTLSTWTALPNPGPNLQDASAKAYKEAYALLLEEKWPAALSAFRDFVSSFAQSDWADDAAFWLCYIQEKTQVNGEEVFDCFRHFVEMHRKSEWRDDAKRNLVRIAHQLAKQGKAEYQHLVRDWGDRDEDREIELTALAALSDIGDEASIQTIMRKLDSTDHEAFRAKITRILEDHAELEPVWNKLVSVAKGDASAVVRRSATKALAEGRRPDSLPVLKEIAGNDADPEVRRTAVRELGDLGKAEILPFLKEIALTETEIKVAAAAVQSISDVRTKEAMDALTSLFQETQQPRLRREIIREMADRSDRVTQLAFFQRVVMNDPHEDVRRAAAYAIGKVRTLEALEILKKVAISSLDLKTRGAALRAIADFPGELAVPHLSELLGGIQDVRLRGYLVECLGETKQDAAVPILEKTARTDPNSKVQQEAVRALGEIGSPKAREALMEIIKD